MEALRAETRLGGSVYASRPEGRAQHQRSTLPIFKLKYLLFQERRSSILKQTGGSMTRDAKDTVYCNVQMPMTQGRELWLSYVQQAVTLVSIQCSKKYSTS